MEEQELHTAVRNSIAGELPLLLAANGVQLTESAVEVCTDSLADKVCRGLKFRQLDERLELKER